MKGEQWDACNSLVTAWIMSSVTDSIVESILYIESAASIWKHLETRFAVSNGSRKYKLNKDVYNLKQNEEQKLFQFLNGLDDVYNTQRSQILMMSPLHSVESVCSMLQQEELQRQVLESTHVKPEFSALLSKNAEARGGERRCTVCHNKGHTRDRCWQIIGYLSWHPGSKQHPQRKTKSDT